MMRRCAVLITIAALLALSPAKAEVTECKAINVLPAIIDSEGIWCLKKDLSWDGSGPAIEIQRSFVTLDLNGHSLKRANGSSGLAIAVFGYDLNNITIRNGTIRGFYQGVQLSHPPTSGLKTRSGRHLIESMTVEQSEIFGLEVTGDGNIVRNNHVVNTRSRNLTQTVGISVVAARNTVIVGNVVSATSGVNYSIGIQVYDSEMIDVRNNSIFDTAKGHQSTWGVLITDHSRAITVDGNRIANASKGTNGILGTNGVSLITCINNVVVGFETSIAGCSFESGNSTL